MSEDDNTKIRLRHRVGRPWIWIIVAAVSALVILFAFVWERINKSPSAADPGRLPHRGRSAIQDTIDELDWVAPAFLPLNEYSRPGILIAEVNSIVIHYVGNPATTAAQNRDYFAGLALSGETYASSNFIIGLDGEILQCVPVDEIAYASNTRNSDTLSIELCHPDESGEFTAETYDAAVRLVAWLCCRFSLKAEDLLRHYDVIGKECPKYFVDNEDAWEQFKAEVAAAIIAEESMLTGS